MQSFLRWILKLVKKPSFLAFTYFTILTCVMTYPVIFRMNELIGGGGGDGTYYVWLIRWYQKALFELHISPFYTPYLNYPQGWYLVTIDTTPAMVALGLPVNLLFGPVVGYNFAMLFSFLLAGWGMYLWVRHLTENNLAGLVAGTIFAFIPYHMAHYIVGHLNVAGIQWFPLYFWGLYDLLKQDKFFWKPVLMASISAVLISLTSPYYLYMTVLMSGVFILGFIVFKGYRQLKKWIFWKSLLAFGLLTSLLVGLSLLPYFDPNARNGLTSFSVDMASRYSASPTDFVLPSVWHFLWGTWIDNTFQPGFSNEATLYIGVLSFILMVLSWVKWRKLQRPQIIGISLTVALAGFILALGIDLHWLGHKVVVLPPFLQLVFHRTDLPQINLPAYYLFRYLPFFSKMRVMMRFGVFTLIFASLMAGLGTHLFLGSFSTKSRKWVALILLVLVFIDFYPGPFNDMAPIGGSPTYTWLATQPDTGAVAIFPFSEESGQRAVYNTLLYNKPFLGGHFNASHPEQYVRITPVMEGFPSADSVNLLRQLGVAYVIVDSTQYAGFVEVDQTIQSLGLNLLHVSSTDFIYGWP